jgi:hypothetical protein
MIAVSYIMVLRGFREIASRYKQHRKRYALNIHPLLLKDVRADGQSRRQHA